MYTIRPWTWLPAGMRSGCQVSNMVRPDLDFLNFDYENLRGKKYNPKFKKIFIGIQYGSIR